MDIILASTSPRRIEMLSWLDLPYKAVASPLDEKSIRHPDPAQLTRLLAEAKAQSVASQHNGAVVIGSDTVVSFNGTILEKPHNALGQRNMLHAQRGQQGEVISSVSVINTVTSETVTHTKVTSYHLANLTDEQIEHYVASGQGLDKAGGFGLQDENGLFIKQLDGCYTNALGFPLCEVKTLLTAADITVSADVPLIVQQRTGRAC